LEGLRCEADVVFPRLRIVVFIDGCYWHGCPDHSRIPVTNSDYWSAKIGGNIARDERNNAALAAAGWIVLRFWEHEPTDTILAAIQAAVVTRRSAV
jgi:DNA mismatch endonuclease (patch repair protein)